MQPLAYSTNLHAAEDAAALAAELAAFAGTARERLGWDELGLDLRLGSAALRGDLVGLRRTLDRHRLRVTTLNGFPLRPFQAARVKEDAYLPDWSEAERLDDSLRLIDAALLLSDAAEVTVSTCPGSFRPLGPARNNALAFARALGVWAAAAAQAALRTGRRVVLCPEPEPWCLLETSWDAAWFWRGPLATAGVEAAAERLDGDDAAARTALAAHLGLCYDTCHLALACERHEDAVARLTAAGVRIAKVQVSAAPQAAAADSSQMAALAGMAEPRFLHQSVLADAHGSQARCVDLDGLAAAHTRLPGAVLARSHFHVPIDAARLANGLATTAVEARAGLAACRAAGCASIGVETYTWPLLAADPEARLAGTVRELATLRAWCDD